MLEVIHIWIRIKEFCGGFFSIARLRAFLSTDLAGLFETTDRIVINILSHGYTFGKYELIEFWK